MIRSRAALSGLFAFSGLLSASITTTTTLTSVTPAAPVFGQVVTLTATVSPATASGSVSFMDRGVLVGSAKVNASGIAQATTLTLSAGSHSLVAVYGGNTSGGYAASQSAALIYIVTVVSGSGFVAAVGYGTGSSSFSVAESDFNGDGKTDLAVSNNISNNVSVLLGNGNGTFQTAVNYAVGSDALSLAVGDFNGDGNADLAVASGIGVSVLLGNGNGTFKTAVDYAAGLYAHSVAVGDFNGDGNADLAIANYGGGLSVLLGNGDGTFQTAVNYAIGSQPISVVAGDFNGDGKPDLAVSNNGDNNLSVLLGNGDGTFKAAVNYAAGSNPEFMAAGDFNGDGKLDLTVAGGDGVAVLLGKGDGTFQSPVYYPSAYPPWSIAVGDFNGDGKPDLVTANFGFSNVSVLLGNGNGAFQAGTSYAAGTNSLSVTVGDFNGDGVADLAVADQGNAFSSIGVSVLIGIAGPPSPSIVLVSSANPSTFGQAVTLTATATPSTASGTVEFLDGISVVGAGTLAFGQAQIATSLLPSGASSLQAVYAGMPGVWQSSQSNLVHQVANPVAAPSFSASVVFPTGSDPNSFVAVGDFNKDGAADLALVGNGGLSVLLGNGNGTFQTAVNYPAGSSPDSVAVGDFNGDGKPDVAVAYGSSNLIAVLLGYGNGTFVPVANYPGGSFPGSVQVADFNGDGNADLVVADSGGSAVSVLLGVGNGTFLPPVVYPAGYEAVSVAVGDFNGDGRADLAVANFGAKSVGILLGNGDGTFQTVVSHGVGTNPRCVVVADFNGDGEADVAVANLNSDNLSVLLGNGDGTLQAAVNYSTGAETYSVATGDFNGDGKPDLAAATTIGVNLLLGNGDGTFQTGPIYTVGTSPDFVTSADFNGDGRTDLAVADGASGIVSILLGTGSLPPGPSPFSVGPATGYGFTQTFSFTFTDPAGFSDLSVVDVLMNNYLDGIGACYVALVPASSTSGYLYLVNDTGDGYVTGTPMLLPSSGALHNSQCTINGAGSSVSAGGDTLTLTLSLTFPEAFIGDKIFYMAARSATQNSGWQALGTWLVPAGGPPGPEVEGVVPGRSVSMGQTYTFTFTDSFGYGDLAVLDILTNSFLDGIDACYVAYVPTSASNGYLYLVDDAGDGGYASGSPILLSSGGTLQNSQCTINTAGSSASASDTTLNLNLAIVFSPSFAGNQVFYLAARNSTTGNSGWQAAGSVTVP